MADPYFDNLFSRNQPSSFLEKFKQKTQQSQPMSGVGPMNFSPLAPSAGAHPMEPMTPPNPSGPNPFGSLQNPGFDDPATNQLMQFLNARFSHLTNPQSDPGGDAFSKLLSDQLSSVTSQFGSSAFSAPQLQQLRTGAFDSLAHANTQQMDAKKRELAQRGITPTSGLYSEGLKEVGEGYQRQVGDTTQNLANYEIGQQQAHDQRLFNQSMSLGSAMNALGSSRRQEQNNNLNQALSLMQLPVGLTQDRLAQMMNVLNGAGSANPSSLLQTMLTLGEMNNKQNNFNTANNIDLWAALGPLLANLPIGGSSQPPVGV